MTRLLLLWIKDFVPRSDYLKVYMQVDKGEEQVGIKKSLSKCQDAAALTVLHEVLMLSQSNFYGI